MSSMWGQTLKIALFGQSHSEGLGVVVDGLPVGEAVDMEQVRRFLQRRAGGRAGISTPRKESDEPRVLSGLVNGVTCGAPLCAVFDNANAHSADYEATKDIPRPSHADYTAHIKYGGHEDARGGGHFSGRLTLPLCFAGAVCKQILSRRGVEIGAHIYAISDIQDTPYDAVKVSAADFVFGTADTEASTATQDAGAPFPARDAAAGQKMIEAIKVAASQGDSLGGVVEAAAVGVPAGWGSPLFDNVESRLASLLFAVPAVKGVEFGAGFAGSTMTGSAYNDAFCMDDGTVKTATNHCGGILGGITNGMPLVFRVAFKPTPSIFKSQRSVNLSTGEAVELTIKGRHDPCIVLRAVPCVEAAAAMALLDLMLSK